MRQVISPAHATRHMVKVLADSFCTSNLLTFAVLANHSLFLILHAEQSTGPLTTHTPVRLEADVGSIGPHVLESADNEFQINLCRTVIISKDLLNLFIRESRL